MRIYATVNERTVRCTFREQNFGEFGLLVIGKDLPPFVLNFTRKNARTFIVRVLHSHGRKISVFGKADQISVEQAREKAGAAIAAAKTERETEPLFADLGKEFMRRQGRRWKPSTKNGDAHPIDRLLVPSFGEMRVSEVVRTAVRLWFASLSGKPGNANRTRHMPSVLMRQAEHWDIRPQGFNPCRSMRRYTMTPRERFLSLAELKRLGVVLENAEDEQAAAASCFSRCETGSSQAASLAGRPAHGPSARNLPRSD